ncbi:hypothetical protein R4Z10_09890 [Niallia sp. XMNu-256]|uniref:hypothetical protein n=1 Tax=Niallia sp. XMNu-256 TaxID=3082444 RepID=UPI0030D4C6E3
MNALLIKKLKKIAIICIGFIFVIGLVAGYIVNKNWVYRYKSELDHFFGKGNWEYISKETLESGAYSEYNYSRHPNLSGERPGKYNKWHIRYNEGNEEEIWTLSNHVYKINNNTYGLLSPRKLSSKQALYFELMLISFDILNKELFNELIGSELSEKEAYPIDVSIYYNGKPNPKFYSALSKETWFTVDRVTVENYLSSDLHDFHIKIRAFDYRLNELTNKEKQNVFNSLETIEKKVLDKYGEHATFRIYFDKEHQVEYIDGVKQ